MVRDYNGILLHLSGAEIHQMGYLDKYGYFYYSFNLVISCRVKVKLLSQ